MKRLTGVFGGTFSPPHIGHVLAAEAFLKAVPLDELIIMPDFRPPHKEIDGKAGDADRFEMCKLAFGHIEKAFVSDLEMKRQGKSYTALTLEELSSDDLELYFLCGTDMFLTLGEWYRPDIIFDLATICYIRRESDPETEALIRKRETEYKERFGAKVIPVNAAVTEISSSELRLSLAERSTELLNHLTPSVYEYICKKGLYL